MHTQWETPGTSETLQVQGLQPLAMCPLLGMGQSDDHVILQRQRHNVLGQRLDSICSDQHLFVGSGNIYNWSSGRKWGATTPCRPREPSPPWERTPVLRKLSLPNPTLHPRVQGFLVGLTGSQPGLIEHRGFPTVSGWVGFGRAAGCPQSPSAFRFSKLDS